MRILCVCLGNICRSPMAEGVLRAMAADAGLAVEIDSAGTGGWHTGQPPHPLGLATAAKRGYDTSAQRARQVQAADFTAFDLILAMDRDNLHDLARTAPSGTTAEIRLFHPAGQSIPDPYGESAGAYDHTLDMVEEAARALIDQLAAQDGGKAP